MTEELKIIIIIIVKLVTAVIIAASEYTPDIDRAVPPTPLPTPTVTIEGPLA